MSAIRQIVTLEPTRSSGRAASDYLRALIGALPPLRLATGIAPLDVAHRGGLPFPRFVILAGAPGAGKTTLATAVAYGAARAGHPVAFFAQDEGGDGIADRLGQLTGIPRHQIEERDEVGLERACERLQALRVQVFDADEGATLEDALAWLATTGAGLPGVLVVDSLQTVRLASAEGFEPRAKVDAVVAVLKAAARTQKLLVLATSEVSRGAYRNRDQAQNVDPLAAAKESGGIEYAAESLLVLRSVKGALGLVEAVVAKNRGGERPTFRLRQTGVTFEEAPDGEEEGDTRAQNAAKRLESDAKAIVAFLATQPAGPDGVPGHAALGAALRGRKLPMSNDRMRAAVAYAIERGEIENRSTRGKTRFHATGRTSAVLADE